MNAEIYVTIIKDQRHIMYRVKMDGSMDYMFKYEIITQNYNEGNKDYNFSFAVADSQNSTCNTEKHKRQIFTKLVGVGA